MIIPFHFVSRKRVVVKALPSLLFFALAVFGPSFQSFKYQFSGWKGAWLWQEADKEQVITMVDGYFTLGSYDPVKKQFDHTWGGPFQERGHELEIVVEFDTREPASVGSKRRITVALQEGKLVISSAGGQQVHRQLDPGQSSLSGVWRISGRKQGDQMSEMALGARRTLKILSGTRFQWVAINVATGEFFGTGGGTYEFSDGHYTETIRFFSRDSSRVGARLRFDGKLVNGDWHHSGLSSRGDPIYEVWTRMYKP